MYHKLYYLIKPAIIGYGVAYFIKSSHCAEREKAFDKAPDGVHMTGEEFNRITQGVTKFKFINDDMTHRGLKYAYGINIDPIPMSDYMCKAGGLHFTSGKVLGNWIDFGNRLWRVSIPDDASVLCYGDKCKANKLILEEEIMKIYTEKRTLEFFRNLGITDMNILKNYSDFSSYTPEQLIDFLNNGIVLSIPEKYRTSEFYEAGLKKEYFEWSDIPAEHRTYRLYALAGYIATEKKLFF